MPRFDPLHLAYPIDRQLDIDTGPIVMINLLTMAHDDEVAFRMTVGAPEFQENLTAYQASITVRPHFSAKVAGPGQGAA